jgi:hypothetical protein
MSLSIMKHEIIKSFLSKATNENAIGHSHICLFLAVYHQWQNHGFVNPIRISRSKLMRVSKIKSFATYHKCIRDLVELDFIRYEPSYHPIGSLIYWTDKILKLDYFPVLKTLELT